MFVMSFGFISSFFKSGGGMGYVCDVKLLTLSVITFCLSVVLGVSLLAAAKHSASVSAFCLSVCVFPVCSDGMVVCLFLSRLVSRQRELSCVDSALMVFPQASFLCLSIAFFTAACFCCKIRAFRGSCICCHFFLCLFLSRIRSMILLGKLSSLCLSVIRFATWFLADFTLERHV